MITIEEIFSLTKSQLKNKLLEYEDETHYSNNLEMINAVIIHSFNNSLLISEEMEIVESDNYDRVMNLNPTSYSDFLNLLKPRKKINININPELLKSWNTPKVTTLEGHTRPVNCVAVSSIINIPATLLDIIGKRYIISGSRDNTIKIWDLSTFKLVTTLEGHTSWVRSVAASGIINTTDEFEKQYIISGSDDKTIKIWNFSTFELVETLEGHNPIMSIAISGIINTTDKFGKQYIISGLRDGIIKIWDLSTFELAATLKMNLIYKFNSVTVSGKYIISGSGDETITIWDLSTFELVTTLEGHTHSVSSVVVSGNTNFPDNIGKQYIISGSWDNTIKIWNLSTFELITTLEGHTSYVNSVTISSIFNATNKFGKQYIISGSDDETIKIWEQT